MFNITDSDNSGAIDSDELSTVASLVPRDGPSLDTLASTAGLIPVEMLDIPSFPSPPVAFSSESGTVSGSDLNLPTSDTPAIRTSPEPDAAAIPDVVEIAVDVPENTVLPPRSKTEKTVLLDVVPSSIKSIRINQPDRELPISNGADGSWAIKDSSLNGEPVIAVIFRQESHIFWQWQPAAIRSAMANSLPNAFLNFDFDMGQPIGLALRSPNIFSDWRPDLEQGETRNIYALEPAPDRTTYVMVQVVAPGEIKTEWDSAEITTPFRRGERTVRFVNSREKLVTVQTRLEWTGNHRFTLNLHAELRLDPAASWVSANVPLLDARNQQLEAYRLACQQQLTFLKENYGSTRQEPQRSMVRSQRDRLEITLKQIDLIAKRMTSARSLLHDLQTRSQWHLEIATPWPNRVPQVILKLEPEAVVSAAQSKDKPERPKDKPE